VGLAAGAGYAWWRFHEGRAKAAAAAPPVARPVPVVTAESRQGDLPIYLNGLGTVTAFNTVTVRTRVDGELVKVAFGEGQQIKEGDQVNEGDLLAEVDPRPFQVQLLQAKGQLARDEAILKNAKVDLQRYEDARDAIPQQQIDTAAANVAQYEGAVLVDQSQIDNANLQLTYCHITAPLSGKIGLRLVDQGNFVHASDANGLAVITQLRPIAVQFTLPQDNLPQVLGAFAAAPLPVDAYDRDFKARLASGQLLAVDNQIDTVTATIRLKAKFDNADGSLFPNQFVNVRLLVDTKRGVVLVPAAAVQRSPQSMFVYVKKADDTVEVRPVTLGPTEGDTCVIAEGLAAGERVVTDGVDKLRAGTKVSERDPGSEDHSKRKPESGAAPPETGGRSGKAKGKEAPKP